MTFLHLLSETPPWVWIILIYILVKGIKTLRPRIVSLYSLLIIPLLFTALSVQTLFTLPLNYLRIGCFLLTSFIGIGIGFWQISRLFIEVDRIKKRLYLPGSPTALILMILIFALKYYLAYVQAIIPAQMHSSGFIFIILAASGLCSGIFLGRAVCYFCRFISLPHKDLSSAKK